MAFRSDEAMEAGFERARRFLIPIEFDLDARQSSEGVLKDLIRELGPVVDAYPSWHPLVSRHKSVERIRFPSIECGYKGLMNTVLFAQGFVSCPYTSNQSIIDAVKALPSTSIAKITASPLPVNFFNRMANPVVVRCEWNRPLARNKMVPKNLAVPLMLEQELPRWRRSLHPESWEVMRPYLLGEPHGRRSSLFVDQGTALGLKKIYLSLVESGMFGLSA